MKKASLIATIVFAVIGAYLIYEHFDGNKDLNSKKINFANEYTLVSKENVFVYKNTDATIDMLEKGTGIVFMAFKESPHAQYYAKYINEVAKEKGIKEISYYNILANRTNNTAKYQTITNILKDYLYRDDFNKHRVNVPDLTFVINGKIIAHDNEGSFLIEDVTAKEYWNETKVNEFKQKIGNYMDIYLKEGGK